MNLYLVKSHEPFEYDTFYECVVSAENEDDARTIHPSDMMDDAKYKDWIDGFRSYYADSWIPFERRNELEVKLIGESFVPRGLVCSSFMAG